MRLLDALPIPFEADAAFDAFANWVADGGITLYPAQEESLIEIVSGANLILSTPTGTGKSLVATGAHFTALAQGRRTFYTAPIKALVSEKFFALVEIFGAQNVGMMTGDSAVNADAPIICCTAEILANLSLRMGPDTPVGQVVMDEFHFYSEPDRGWAWQVPLLTLPNVQFILMSATLGDVSWLADDLSRRTGRETAVVTGVERPVPLHYYYATTPVHETIDELLTTNQSPVYVVHFSQLAALERAQALTSSAVATRAQRDEIGEAIAGFRFTTSFGKTLNRLLRAGIGVHHAGMLPKYRRLVEQLAQRGLLRVICGTDTLGVGINVPIRTVLITALTKFDGIKMRQLNAREFHQIAGRAGRAGYDTAGTVVVQAPEHEAENAKAVEKAGDDPKKKKKIVRKKPPEGFVSWGEPSFTRIVSAEPERLSSSMQVSHAMLLNVIARGGDAFQTMRDLIFDNHEPWLKQLALARTALAIYRTLRTAGIVTQTPQADGSVRIRLTVELQPNFALNQPLSPFALAVFELLDPGTEDAPSSTYALDMISVLESTLDDPRPVISAQQFAARGEAVAAMKAEGIEYDQRMELLESVTHPKPLEELLEAAFETYSASQPWIGDFELRPKSVVRDLYERSMSFGEFIAFYKLARSEGVVLRYLSDAYRAARQTIPTEAKTEELLDLIEWLGELVRQVDSSLLDEWEELIHPDLEQLGGAEIVPPPPPSILTNRRAFTVLVRNELFRRVQLASREAYDALGELETASAALSSGSSSGPSPSSGLGHVLSADEWADALDPYFEEHDTLLIDADARNPRLLSIDESRADAGAGVWLVRQTLHDPQGYHDWGIDAEVDLPASVAEGTAIVRVTGVSRL
ncbi:helicase-like protein [Compostimonas suwonensis]|uniref:Helicase-like protein n=2 Tax=Compostimonas suwonensis TaxID=1048394 RepID=A0A2M9BTY1_9MICO|nr:DEAD/DEAH box helicase [Compostimonas suwonensis]PJJ61418.1 helicase-like protein [Compostimonas suwonensis]